MASVPPMLKKRLAVFLVAASVLVAGTSSATGQPALAAWLYATAQRMEHSAAPGESVAAYQARLEIIARSVAGATKPYSNGRGWTASELGLAVLRLWKDETQFDERIHAGTGHPVWHQDHGRAKCMGQIHVSRIVPQEEWERLTGTDEGATALCAEATARVWVAHARNCGVWSGQRADRDKVAKVFAAYASGGTCTADRRAYERADRWMADIARRPDRSPVKGYRRAMPSEVPPEVKTMADGMVSQLSPAWPPELRTKLGDTSTPTAPELAHYKLLVENHAGGKIGVSVLVKIP